MLKRYFRLRPSQHGSLQEKTRELLLEAIHSGTLPPEAALPSCRQLAAQLGVSRNTVAIVYEGLVEDGYLISRPCSGYYLNAAYTESFAGGPLSANASSQDRASGTHAKPDETITDHSTPVQVQAHAVRQDSPETRLTSHPVNTSNLTPSRPHHSQDASSANISGEDASGKTAAHILSIERHDNSPHASSDNCSATAYKDQNSQREKKAIKVSPTRKEAPVQNPEIGRQEKKGLPPQSRVDPPGRHAAVDWRQRFSHQPSIYTSVPRPSRWNAYPFPFIYGQHEVERFPLAEWRISARRLLDERQDKRWLNDSYDQDDAALIEQLRTRILPRRGIIAESEEILITLGAQNALFLIAQLLFTHQTQVSIENPGYRDAFNIFSRQGAQLDFCAVDEYGITLSETSKNSHYLYVTPSQQVPCGMSMSPERRHALLDQAVSHDQIIIEDDYDAELKIAQASLPALRSHPEGSRVIYLSSFSKTLSPGLRLGYIVADAELIDELRALRRLMYRHPPTSLQRQLAQFIAQGHFDRCLRHHQQDNSQRWTLLEQARQHYLPDCQRISSEYANAFWLKAPSGCDTEQLRWRAAHQGVLIEPGAYHFFTEDDACSARQCMRLGFGAIQESRIDEGIRRLDEALHTL